MRAIFRLQLKTHIPCNVQRFCNKRTLTNCTNVCCWREKSTHFQKAQILWKHWLCTEHNYINTGQYWDLKYTKCINNIHSWSKDYVDFMEQSFQCYKVGKSWGRSWSKSNFSSTLIVQISPFQMCHSHDRTKKHNNRYIFNMSFGSLWHQEKVLVKGLSEPMERVWAMASHLWLGLAPCLRIREEETFWALVDLSPYGRPLAEESPLPHLPPLPPLTTEQKPWTIAINRVGSWFRTVVDIHQVYNDLPFPPRCCACCSTCCCWTSLWRWSHCCCCRCFEHCPVAVRCFEGGFEQRRLHIRLHRILWWFKVPADAKNDVPNRPLSWSCGDKGSQEAGDKEGGNPHRRDICRWSIFCPRDILMHSPRGSLYCSGI